MALEESLDAKESDTFKQLQRWYKRDVRKARKWREEAEEDFRYYNGHHWTDEEKKTLQSVGKPALVFNRTAVLVNAIIGNEISNRREVNFFPREQGDVKANELLGAAAEWFRDGCDAEDEESEAFQGTLISGMGWTETRLDFDADIDGSGLIEEVDAFEMVWDADAKKPNLSDSTRLFRVRDMTLENARMLFPGVDDAKLNASWAKLMTKDGELANDPDDAYQGEDEEKDAEAIVTIVEAQWFDYIPFYRLDIPDPQTGQSKRIEVDPERFKLMQQAKPDLSGLKQRKRVVKKAFLGTEILEPVVDGLCPQHFSYQCTTGYYDKDSGTWYGVVRATKDPQRWANKLMSQIIQILNTTSKGGIMAERGAFDDDLKAEESWAKQDVITWLKKNAMAEGKIQPKPQTQMPVGFFQLMEYAVSSIRDVTGINLEMLGMREADQAGVLEYQRREAGQIILAKLFNALRRYRKTQGQILLYLIQTYLSDGRLIRILGEDKKEYVPLMKAENADVKYDIIVDDAPTSPNEKEKTWGILVQMMPFLKDSLDADMALELMAYSPLPASIVDKLKTAAKKKQEAQAPVQEQKQAMEMDGAQATIDKVKAEGANQSAQAEQTQVETALLPMQAQAEAIASLMKLAQPKSNSVSGAPAGQG